MSPPREEVERLVDALVDEQRSRCLWFLRRDYFPRTDPERVETLLAIQRHGDLEAFRRAGELKAWLSPSSSTTSARS